MSLSQYKFSYPFNILLYECTTHLFPDLQSCVHAVLEFVSPENVTEGIHLIDEVRLLPEDHKAKADMLEVDLVMISFISSCFLLLVAALHRIDKPFSFWHP